MWDKYFSMMTTAKTFGIVRPNEHFVQKQDEQQERDDHTNSKKFEILSEALKKFMNNEITQEQLSVIQNSLK